MLTMRMLESLVQVHNNINDNRSVVQRFMKAYKFVHFSGVQINFVQIRTVA